jgi:hypothetical protein
MKAEEIERIKQGVVNAITKAPGNLILRDLERSILTVEKYKAVLEKIRDSGNKEGWSQAVAQSALTDSTDQGRS